MTTEFVNLAVPEAWQQYAAVVASIAKDDLPLPLVAINGQVKMAGGVDYYSIVSAIESLTTTQPAAATTPAAS